MMRTINKQKNTIWIFFSCYEKLCSLSKNRNINHRLQFLPDIGIGSENLGSPRGAFLVEIKSQGRDVLLVFLNCSMDSVSGMVSKSLQLLRPFLLRGFAMFDFGMTSSLTHFILLFVTTAVLGCLGIFSSLSLLKTENWTIFIVPTTAM